MTEAPRLALREWSALRCELAWIYDRVVLQASRKQVHVRNRDYHAWFLRAGTCRFFHDSGNVRIRPGQWFLVPSGRGRHDFSADAHLLSIRFSFAWPSGERFIRNERGLLLQGSDYPELESRATRLAKLVQRSFPLEHPYQQQSLQSTDGGLFLRIQSAFQLWMESWLDLNLRSGLSWTKLGSGDDRLLQAARCLNEAALEVPYPRERLLGQSGLSDVHLTRLFLEEFGLSPRKYWDQRRLAFAKNCLETSLMPVKELAWRVGFRSDSHFAVWFRRLTGKRPGEFRLSPSVSVAPGLSRKMS